MMRTSKTSIAITAFSKIGSKNQKIKYMGQERKPLPSNMPEKEEYLTMHDLLIDAERYENGGSLEIRDSTLTALSEYIERYKAKKTKDV